MIIMHGDLLCLFVCKVPHIRFCAHGVSLCLFVCKVMHIQFCAHLFVFKVMHIHAVALSQSIDCSPDKQKISFLILPAAAFNLQNLIKWI